MIRGISPFSAGEAANFLRASSSTACFGSGAPSGLISSAVTSGSAIIISDLFACSCARFAYRPVAQNKLEVLHPQAHVSLEPPHASFQDKENLLLTSKGRSLDTHALRALFPQRIQVFELGALAGYRCDFFAREDLFARSLVEESVRDIFEFTALVLPLLIGVCMAEDRGHAAGVEHS
ncbi:hypothetical protein KCU83_g351, partial [Aureobasidium melanogenum]